MQRELHGQLMLGNQSVASLIRPQVGKQDHQEENDRHINLIDKESISILLRCL